MIGEWCKEHSTSYSCKDIIETLKYYVSGMDGSTLTKQNIKDVCKMYQLNPELLSLVCNAFEMKGYDSF